MADDGVVGWVEVSSDGNSEGASEGCGVIASRVTGSGGVSACACISMSVEISSLSATSWTGAGLGDASLSGNSTGSDAKCDCLVLLFILGARDGKIWSSTDIQGSCMGVSKGLEAEIV